MESQEKFIKQIKLRSSKNEFAPYRHLNPYSLLNQLNKAVEKMYEMEFIHVKYVMTKSKGHKILNDAVIQPADLKIDKDFNNIFSLSQDADKENFMKEYILKNADLLKPPLDFNPESLEKEMEQERRNEQQKKLDDLKKSLDHLVTVYNKGGEEWDSSYIRSIQSFQKQFSRDEFTQGEFEIYAKAILSDPVLQRIQQEKNNNKPIQIKVRDFVLRLFMHPTPTEKQSISQLTIQHPLTDWALSTELDQSILKKQNKNEEAKKEQPVKQFCDYFSSEDLLAKVKKINGTIQLISTISFHEVNGVIQGINITSKLWNELMIKIYIQIRQIKQISYGEEEKQNKKRREYYFYLKYPPRFYICALKKDEAFTYKYIKNWQRVENFIFFGNKLIQENDLLRMFLFNNTVLKIKLVQEEQTRKKIENTTKEIHYKIIKKFSETIPQKQLDTPFNKYEYEKNFKKFTHKFQKKQFLNKLKHVPKQQVDKIWVIKYLILVMIRHNHLLPSEVAKLLNHIENSLGNEKNKQNEQIKQIKFEYLQYYLFVLWKTTTDMWGYNSEKRFLDYLIEEFQTLKRLGSKNIMNRVVRNSELIVYIFRASLTPSGYLFDPPTPQMKGRLIREFSKQSDFFLRVAIAEENQNELKNQKYITKRLFRKQMNSIKILNREYIPLGWSPSQLRSSSIWYICQFDKGGNEILTREHILSFLGQFDQIANPAKRAARIGQSFSASWNFIATHIKSVEIPDLFSESKHNFTDGIGKISTDLVQNISLKLGQRKLSVVQVRYKGAKGVLALDTRLPINTIQLRGSMIKYQCPDSETNKYLDILDWNKYKPGFLNRQTIILLRTLGIEDKQFQRLQKQHIDFLSNMTFKDNSIFKQMHDDLHTQICDLEPANKTILDLINAKFNLEEEPFFRGVLETMKKNGYYQLKVKCSIRVKKSARIIGIIDQYGILKENQIYCSVYDPFDTDFQESSDNYNGAGYTVSGPCIITRNPCLHPADIRKVVSIGDNEIQSRFKNIGIDQNLFKPFVNCVIFPIQGKIPLTAQISGSDLDGDNFFVCWDDRLIPEKQCDTYVIDEPATKKSAINKKVQINYDEMLQFFIDYINYEKLGQIDNSHLIKADQDTNNYANNKDCLRLAEIHGKAVDFPKTGKCPPVPIQLLTSQYPDFMEKQNAKSTYPSKSILGQLYRDIKSTIQNLIQNQNTCAIKIDQDLIKGFSQDSLNKKDIESCIDDLVQYERTLSNLKNLINADTEYEIYSGNFSTVKDKVKSFGKNRLIASIIQLRERFFQRFFSDLDQKDAEKYRKTDNNLFFDKSHYFGKETQRKAQLYYLVSYIFKFSDLKQENQMIKRLKILMNEVFDSMGIMKKQSEFHGFIWFVIPKIIMNLKITAKKEEEKEKEEQKYQGMIEERNDYDDGQLNLDQMQ